MGPWDRHGLKACPPDSCELGASQLGWEGDGFLGCQTESWWLPLQPPEHLTGRGLGMGITGGHGAQMLATASAGTEAVFPLPTQSLWPFTGPL